MAAKEESTLIIELQRFNANYGNTFAQLQKFLDAAGISHYSSGCDNKHVAFNLFPASQYIECFCGLLDLDREPVTKNIGGFKDASVKGSYNPACEFIMYLRRWSLFCEQVMRNEGETARGIAGARAKLLLDELFTQLSEEKTGPMLKSTLLGRIMRAISAHLEEKANSRPQSDASQQAKLAQENYLKALAAAQNLSAKYIHMRLRMAS